MLGAVHVGMEIGLKHDFPTTVFFVTLHSTLTAGFGLTALGKQQGLIMSVVSLFDS